MPAPYSPAVLPVRSQEEDRPLRMIYNVETHLISEEKGHGISKGSLRLRWSKTRVEGPPLDGTFWVTLARITCIQDERIS